MQVFECDCCAVISLVCLEGLSAMFMYMFTAFDLKLDALEASLSLFPYSEKIVLEASNEDSKRISLEHSPSA